jgi:putative transposase
MHVHLVFVTKFRLELFTKTILNYLRSIFTRMCAGFETERVEFDGEDNHVHLLVNSLKGRSSHLVLKKKLPEQPKKL